ncbi:Valine--tRNA ligase [Gossypium arboreum]|uniref:Valine--tRNA ligase n=1 Tax=Gossypium arboreum TaxID=29729 RepID=A0A0B0NSK3_GOSAR|nr:Valine--tRNA ligase [Gossypium arboreum]
MCQCKTMSGTWHQHRYARACVKLCLGHGIGTYMICMKCKLNICYMRCIEY